MTQEFVSPVSGSNSQYLRLSGPIEHDSIVNGYGLRAVIWTQGCFIGCEGCQNQETWDPEGGVLVSVEDIKDELRQLKGQTGLTFCGAKPSIQPVRVFAIPKFPKKELGWNVWSFSGYTYDEIKAKNNLQWEFFKILDALIDGPFVLAERDLTLKFRGSRNQRLLHLKDGEITSIE